MSRRFPSGRALEAVTEETIHEARHRQATTFGLVEERGDEGTRDDRLVAGSLCHQGFMPRGGGWLRGATSINQNRNVLMQEFDRFEGVVVMTTKLLGNYDDALLRRVQRHFEFRLPDASMKRELLALLLPNPERLKANLRSLAEQSRGLSGGDIPKICLNAIHAGSRNPDPAKWLVTEEMRLREIKRAKAAKKKHSGRRTGGRRIGFRA